MLIGIIEKARSGKDTFAVMLAEELFNITRQRYVLMAYAHELKIRVQKDFDMSYDQLWGDEKEKSDLRYAKRLQGLSSNPIDYWTPREVLQSYGEFYRTIDCNFWVKHLFEIIDDREYKCVIITDVRHINEADPIVKKGGTLIKVVRDEDKATAIHGQDHISETSLNEYNDIEFVIENNETLKELKAAARKLAAILINKK